MIRQAARRMSPTLEALEGRASLSGLGSMTQAAATSYILPYIEQDNFRAPGPIQQAGDGGAQRIIAILIG